MNRFAITDFLISPSRLMLLNECYFKFRTTFEHSEFCFGFSYSYYNFIANCKGVGGAGCSDWYPRQGLCKYCKADQRQL